MGDIHSVCNGWMSSSWDMLNFSWAWGCWWSLGSEMRCGQGLGRLAHLRAYLVRALSTCHGRLRVSSNEVVNVAAFTHEDWVDASESVNHKSVNHKSRGTTVILIESEAPVFLKANLTGKHRVYTDSCVYRVIVLGCYRSHWVYLCLHVYIIQVLGWAILQRRIAED